MVLADSTIKRVIYIFHTEYTLSDLLRVRWPAALAVVEKQQLCERTEGEPGTSGRRLSQ